MGAAARNTSRVLGRVHLMRVPPPPPKKQPPAPKKSKLLTRHKTVELCLLTSFLVVCALLFLGASGTPRPKSSPTLPSRRGEESSELFLLKQKLDKLEAKAASIAVTDDDDAPAPYADSEFTIQKVAEGCHTVKDEERCVHSFDGRDASLPYGAQPCAWCCGKACLHGEDDNLCEPANWIATHPNYSGRSRSIDTTTETSSSFEKTTTIKKDTCSQPERTGPTPRPELSASNWDSSSTIFVAVASYRDEICHETIGSLFKNAAFPDRVVVGLVQQSKPDDPDCVEQYCDELEPGQICRRDQIRIKNIPAAQAKGVTVARYETQQLLADEKFWFQVDSHTHFKKTWDIILISDWEAANDPRAILTAYPLALEHEKDAHEYSRVPRICGYYWNGAMPFNQQALDTEVPDKPLRTLFWAAGMSFSLADSERKVPYDPHTEFLFSGEEIHRAVRYWTHGFNFYTPSQNTIFHYYYRKGAPRNDKFNAEKSGKERAARNRILHLLGAKTDGRTNLEEIEEYGLGCAREVKRYLQLTRVNIDTHHLASKEEYNNNCNFADEPVIQNAQQPAGHCRTI